ncbi:unnamed protein product, partial [marine sediment metagenome]
ANLGEKAHGSLTGVTADQHHPEFTSGQHRSTTQHPLGTVVPHDALASLTERNHASLASVTASQHHIEFTSGMHSFAHPSALIANGAITSAKIGALAVGIPHIAANAIVSGKVASGGLFPQPQG